MVVEIKGLHFAWKVKFLEFVDDDVATAETSLRWAGSKCSNLGAGRYQECLHSNNRTQNFSIIVQPHKLAQSYERL